ncbi:MAG: ISL3 family transposase [Mycobacterium sp.]|nr:ISL3 family transposase [Mycobacterium sp.]
MSSDSTTVLFGLPGVRVKKVACAADGARVVHVVPDDEAAAACPQCGVVSTSVRQRRTSRPRDVPYGEQPLRVRWHKVQYACQQDACPRKAFTEQIDELPAGARVTGRLRRHVATRIGEGLPVSVAGAGLLGWPAAHDAFVAAVVEQLPEPEPVRVLGIDETRRGKPRWARDAGSGTWTKLETFETNFVDLAGTQGLLGQASGRTKANVVAWLTDRGQAWTDAVEVVAMDPCATYRAAVAEALPRARIVADHFHLVRLANQALTDVRRRVTWITHGRRGRASDPEWAQRRRLLRGYERLTGEQFRRMWNDLVDADPSGRILTAWITKEELRRLLACARTGGHRQEISARLHRFNAWCADSRLPELERLAGTIEAWWPEVLGFLQTGITNAGTEATNRTVKTAARTAYGFRNLENQRRRVRFACTRRNRRVTVC